MAESKARADLHSPVSGAAFRSVCFSFFFGLRRGQRGNEIVELVTNSLESAAVRLRATDGAVFRAKCSLVGGLARLAN